MRGTKWALAATCVQLLAAAFARADNTRVTRPNLVGAELFGKGVLYNGFIERAIGPDFALGAGAGSTGLNNVDGTGTSQMTVLIPVYVNVYFARDDASFYGTISGTFVTNPNGANGLVSSLGGLEFGRFPLVVDVGAGYEYRSTAGFLLRLTAYGMIGRSVAPWVGVAAGFAF